jgi:hypothetical protein
VAGVAPARVHVYAEIVPLQVATEALGLVLPAHIEEEALILTMGLDLTVIVCVADGELHPPVTVLTSPIVYVPGLIKLNCGLADEALPDV